MKTTRHTPLNVLFITFTICLVCLSVIGFSTVPSSAGDKRGLSIDTGKNQTHEKHITDDEGHDILLYEGSYALVLGISKYTNGWPVLPGVEADVEAVKADLEEQGFQVIVKKDLDKSGIDRAFTNFISQYGQNPENRLLFYFAGHGHTVTTSYGEELGYIVPVDAPNPNRNLAAFQSKAMEMQQIEIYARRIQSKHALFLFDACFSGSLFSLSRAIPEVISYKTAKPVRQFITSGSAEETVPDESIFRRQFSRALEGEADSDNDGYVTGTELGEFLQTTVVNYSRNAQHPQYGKIRNPNLDKGDFVFLIPLDEPSVADDSGQSAPLADINFSVQDLQWQARLKKMEQAYAEVNAIDAQEYPKDLKIEAWTRFVNAFSADDPFSTRDNEMLAQAQDRIQYWNTYTELPTPKPTAPPPPPKPVPKSGLRLKRIVVKNEDGRLLRPNNDRFPIAPGKTVTIRVDVEHAPHQQIVCAWTAVHGKVPSSEDLTNTYTAPTKGEDSVTVYVWDQQSGQELPGLPIRFTVVRPEPSAKDGEFRITKVAMKRSSGKVIHPADDIFTLKQGEIVTIVVDVSCPAHYQLEFAWTARKGKIPAFVNTNKTSYRATRTGADLVFVHVWDALTGRELPKFPINISVVP